MINAIRNTPEHTGVRNRAVPLDLATAVAHGSPSDRAQRASAEGYGLGVRGQSANKGRATDRRPIAMPQGYSYRRGIRLSGLWSVTPKLGRVCRVQ